MKGNREEKKLSKMKSDPDLWLQLALPAQFLQTVGLLCATLGHSFPAPRMHF